MPGGDIAQAIWADLQTLPKHDLQIEDSNPTVHAERNPLQKDFHTIDEVEAIAAHLKRSLEGMVVEIFSKARQAAVAAGDSQFHTEPLKVRWIEAFFPFTSPSWELEVFWQGKWLELLGCGVVQQRILIDAGVPDRVGWAFGIGLERVAMLLFSIPDIRLFWSRDPRFLSQFSIDKPITCFVPFSRYPACDKDVAFWLPGESNSAGGKTGDGAQSFHENDIMEIVRDVAGDLVEEVRLVDQFQHPTTKRKSLCYRVNYRSLERTLTNREVNGLHKEVGEMLVEKMGVELR